MADIVVIGEALIDFFANDSKSLAQASSFTPHCGGAPANLAVRAAQIGGDVQFIGRVGADAFGRLIRDTLRGHGVDVAGLIEDRSRATMFAFVSLIDPASPEFLLVPGANINLAAEDVPTSVFGQAKVLAFGSITLAYHSRAAVLDAAQRARTNGVDVIFDVNYRPNIWSSAEEARAQCWRAVSASNIVKLNADEARFLTGVADPIRAARSIRDRGVELVCLTMGAEGCCLLAGESAEACAGFEVNGVDATGSGDAFLAGVCVSLSKLGKRGGALSARELREMGEFANACGAIAATQTGAVESALDSRMVRAFLAERRA